MTSVLRACLSVRAAIHCPCARYVHSTPAAFAKKKSGQDAFDDDLFSAGDLFDDGSAKAPAPMPQPKKAASEVPKQDARKMPPAKRLAKYDSLLQFVTPRLTATGAQKRSLLKHPPFVRKTAFSQLVQLSSTPAQLEQIAELLPSWSVTYDHKFQDHVAEEFVRRCDTLGCPQLAVKVFGNLPRYHFRLSQTAAQRLMHSLYRHRMHQDVLTVAAYRPAHDLCPVEQDLVASAIVSAASIKTSNKVVAVGLLAEIRKKIAFNPKPDLSKRKGQKMKAEVRKVMSWVEKRSLGSQWLKNYLRATDLLAAKSGGYNLSWLAKWRHRSVRAPAPAAT
ncbi:hypothetical protein CPB85DRAFT_1277632 [Mucidula mucida]|nr:hypothetical protein CPB85DRAFT_1277632 [Mucidula mucida]